MANETVRDTLPTNKAVPFYLRPESISDHIRMHIRSTQLIIEGRNETRLNLSRSGTCGIFLFAPRSVFRKSQIDIP